MTSLRIELAYELMSRVHPDTLLRPKKDFILEDAGRYDPIARDMIVFIDWLLTTYDVSRKAYPDP